MRNDAQEVATVNSESIVIILETTIRAAQAGEERTADGRGPASCLPCEPEERTATLSVGN